MSPRVVTRGQRLICSAPPHRHHACHRLVVWKLRAAAIPHGQLHYCSAHFDQYVELNWDALDKYEIERLSENEKDFDQYFEVSSEPLCQVPKPREEEVESKRERLREREVSWG